MEKGLPRQKTKSHLLQGSPLGLLLGSPAVGEQSHLQGALRDGYLPPLPNSLVPGRPATRRQVHCRRARQVHHSSSQAGMRQVSSRTEEGRAQL